MTGKKSLCALTAGIVSLFGAHTAQADCWLASCSTGCMSVPCGWYVEGDAGSSHISDIDYPGDTSSSGIGGNVNAGYKFMPYLGLELGFTRYANTSIEFAELRIATIKNYSYDIALRGIVPFSGSGFEIFAKLGVGRANANLDVKSSRQHHASRLNLDGQHHSATGLYWGVGAQYYLMPEFAIVVMYAQQNGNSSTGDMSLFSAGVNFILN